MRDPLGPVTDVIPPQGPDNDFLLGSEDPMGHACPFGAHIRRANPRDTRIAGWLEEINATNRHRILRVGRTYEPRTDESGKPIGPGLLFMCINADIERQFEFIQKTWLQNPNIHGLENEVDPIMGDNSPTREDDKSNRFSIPTATGTIQLHNLANFVTVKGGGYFFLPARNVLQFLAT